MNDLASSPLLFDKSGACGDILPKQQATVHAPASATIERKIK